MAEEGIFMSGKEIDRLTVVMSSAEGKIRRKEAAGILRITDRQLRRLVKGYKEIGKLALISRKRGAVSNNRISEDKRAEALCLITRNYYDFGPTLAAEKLREMHGITVSKETVRKWMIEGGLWKPKAAKEKSSHQMRERRSRYGEMIQIDGSPHDWFEGRREPCTLIVFIDDATNEFMELRFYETETTKAYMETTHIYLNEFGRPVAFYSDRHGVFRVNRKESLNGIERTQFGRAMKTLDIELINANTPQAKGRVERANQLLQDRLVKELRLRKINTIETANEFLDEYKHALNDKFAVKAKSPENAHRVVLHDKKELDLIFSIHSERIISRNLEVQYDNTIYQIQTESSGLSMRGGRAVISEDFKGNVSLIYKGREMKYKTYRKTEKQSELENAKTINMRMSKVIKAQNENFNFKPDIDLKWKNQEELCSI